MTIRNMCHTYLEQGLFSAAALSFSYGHDVKHTECFGGIEGRQTSASTLFDIASITKLIVGQAIMLTIQSKRLSLDTLISSFGIFGNPDEIKSLTIFDLMLMMVEFILPQELKEYETWMKEGRSGAEWKNLFFKEAKVFGIPGRHFRYSNLPSMILGEVLEVIHGKKLEQILMDEFLSVLGMNNTQFQPLRKNPDLKSLIVPTSLHCEAGIVHDPLSRMLLPENCGVSGLFSTIEDMYRLSYYLATGKNEQGDQIIDPSLHRTMMRNIVGTCNPSINHQWGLMIDKFNIFYDPWHPWFIKMSGVMPGRTGCIVVGCPRVDKSEPTSIALVSNSIFGETLYPEAMNGKSSVWRRETIRQILRFSDVK